MVKHADPRHWKTLIRYVALGPLQTGTQNSKPCGIVSRYAVRHSFRHADLN